MAEDVGAGPWTGLDDNVGGSTGTAGGLPASDKSFLHNGWTNTADVSSDTADEIAGDDNADL